MLLATRRRSRRPGVRRKALFGVMVLVLAYAAWAWSVGLAFTAGGPNEEMDWNADGTVTTQEILQAWYAVTVRVTKQGPRTCRTYFWRGHEEGDPISVTCRTEVGKHAGD